MRGDKRPEAKSGADGPITLTPTEARQGITPHVTRYALGWGLALITLAFIAIYFIQR
jgi:hypothetical protein